MIDYSGTQACAAGLQSRHMRKLRRLLRRSSTGTEAKARIDSVLKRVSEKAGGNQKPGHANDNFPGVVHSRHDH